MTQEEKDLLLRDMCARLPYGVKMTFPDGWLMGIYPTYRNGNFDKNVIEKYVESSHIDCNKPYLRPMSNMTDEERLEYKHLINRYAAANPESAASLVDWLNAHHFDYHGLIEKGLAIAVTEQNNPYK